MTQDEIIEMAQECNLIGMRPHLDGIYSEALVAFANLVAAKALAQHDSVQAKPEPEQEPFAYVNVEKRRLEFAHDYVKWDTPTTIKLDKIPLYTTPPQRTWVGLTRAERFEIEKAMSKYYDYQHECKTVCLPEFAAAIEAKLKEKNT